MKWNHTNPVNLKLFVLRRSSVTMHTRHFWLCASNLACKTMYSLTHPLTHPLTHSGPHYSRHVEYCHFSHHFQDGRSTSRALLVHFLMCVAVARHLHTYPQSSQPSLSLISALQRAKLRGGTLFLSFRGTEVIDITVHSLSFDSVDSLGTAHTYGTFTVYTPHRAATKLESDRQHFSVW